VNLENINLAPTSTLLMELSGTTPGSQYDVLNLSGSGNLAGTLDIELLSGFVPKVGDSFDILNGTITGTFANLDLPSLPGGEQWNTSELYSSGLLTVTPEPSTFALLVIGAISLLFYARRRRRRAAEVHPKY
jgi:hypothetical protein